MAERPRPSTSDLDIVVPRSRTDDGEGLNVLRLREREEQHELTLGELRPLQEGRAIHPSSEIVRLSPREDMPAWNAETLVPPQRQLSGPAQVATDEYRRNYDAIFGDDDDAN
jgi:hypothetical protein